MSEKSNNCCDMHRKVALGIARVYTEEECGVSDFALVDYHDFGYKSQSGAKVAAALSLKFCPWCGVKRDHADQTRRNVEVIRAPNNA